MQQETIRKICFGNDGRRDLGAMEDDLGAMEDMGFTDHHPPPPETVGLEDEKYSE